MDLLSGKSLDGFHGLRWNMLVSGGLRLTPPRINMPIWPLSHQDIPGFESSGFQWIRGVSGGEDGGVYSPRQLGTLGAIRSQFFGASEVSSRSIRSHSEQ